MRFLLGLALVVVAVAIWRWLGRRPVVLRTLENGDRMLQDREGRTVDLRGIVDVLPGSADEPRDWS